MKYECSRSEIIIFVFACLLRYVFMCVCVCARALLLLRPVRWSAHRDPEAPLGGFEFSGRPRSSPTTQRYSAPCGPHSATAHPRRAARSLAVAVQQQRVASSRGTRRRLRHLSIFFFFCVPFSSHPDIILSGPYHPSTATTAK